MTRIVLVAIMAGYPAITEHVQSIYSLRQSVMFIDIYDPNKTVIFCFPKQKYSLYCLNRTISAHVTSCRDRCNFLFGECVHD